MIPIGGRLWQSATVAQHSARISGQRSPAAVPDTVDAGKSLCFDSLGPQSPLLRPCSRNKPDAYLHVACRPIPIEKVAMHLQVSIERRGNLLPNPPLCDAGVLV
jgi:hypothetical protein